VTTLQDHSAQRAALADVVAIPVTPFTPTSGLDEDVYRALLRRMLNEGVNTLTPKGNTGEFYPLDQDERRTVVEIAVAEAGQEAQMGVGVGMDTPTAIDSAEHARAVGAHMVMIHQPIHPYVSRDGWVDYHRSITQAMPELGVVPYLRDARISGAELARLGELCPNVIGVKYAVPDTVRFAAVARDAGLDRFVWIAGLAELYAPGYFAVGATGFTSELVNVAPGLSLAMLNALRGGDFATAMKLWEQIRDFEELRADDSSADNFSVVKEALHLMGLWRREVRPPSRLLPPERRKLVAAAIASWRGSI
jgi:4-hydroxy-tetrahydrodipicolinate synthase